MANTILTTTKILRESLRLLVNNLAFARLVNREYSKEFAVRGAKVGDTINVRKPNRYTVYKQRALASQDVTEQSVAIKISTQAHVPIKFYSDELTLSLDDFGKRILNPAMATLANTIDYDGLAEYKNVPNFVGTAGVTPATTLSILQVGQKLDEESAPRDMDRSLIVNPAANASLVDAHKSLFIPQAKLGEQFMKGIMGNNVLGFGAIAMDQNVNVHTCGSRAASGESVVNGAGQTGSNLVVTGAGTNTYKKGDVFTIANVYAVNPMNGQSTGSLRQFTVTADAACVAGAVTLSISPAIVTTGPYKNVTDSPASGAALTFVGAANSSYPVNLGFHKDAFTLATADLEMPGGVDMAAREVYEGISMRIVRQYAITDDQFPCRVDVMYGYKTIYESLACRLVG